MRQNTPSIQNINEKMNLPLDDIISITISNHKDATAAIYFNFGSEANEFIGQELLPGESASWSVEDNGKFKGVKLYIDFGSGIKRGYLNKIVRGSEIDEKC